MSNTEVAATRGRNYENENTELVFNDENNIQDMYLTFGIAGEEYGVGISYVTEIVGMQRVMEVPDVPAYIKGVINLRGKVIPVMDVRLRFRMPEIAYTERTVIIVLDIDDVPVGLIVDHVTEVMEIAAAQIDAPPRFGSGDKDGSVIQGLGKQDDRVVILLDIERLVSSHTGEITMPVLDVGHDAAL
ncbi:MAG: hypothetical protein RIQ52_376 [Pseudomonadota bacterium]|jgi:purine-binding chemotaxis protein CheW